MENFKQIAEDCLAGKLSGVFMLRNGGSWKSNTLSRYSVDGKIIPGYYVLGKGLILDSNGLNMEVKERVQNFIPDMKKEQITIDIPEGMEAIKDETPDGIKIKFIKKPLSYKDIENKLPLHTKIQTQYFWDLNVNEYHFSKKVEVIRKLTNIRNYFGKPDGTTNAFYIYKSNENEFNVATTAYPSIYANDVVAFTKREHAQAAIDMLGDELKYLFEPW